MARNSNRNSNDDTSHLFENAELHDRISQGKNEIRRLEIRLGRMHRAGEAMYKEMIADNRVCQATNDWENAVK